MSEALVKKKSKPKQEYAPLMPLERRLEEIAQERSQPNPMPHWHVARPAWTTEGPPTKTMTTAWATHADAQRYLMNLPNRWFTARRINPEEHEVCFKSRKGEEFATMIAPSMEKVKARLWKCKNPSCSLGQGVMD